MSENPREPRPSEIANAIDRAANYIEIHGWTRGEVERPNGHVCAEGGLWKVTAPFGRMGWEASDVLDFAVKHDYPSYGSVPDFNDEQRDRRKVVRFMRRTARRLREGTIYRQRHHDMGWFEYSFKEGK